MELATKYKVQALALMLWTLPDWLGHHPHTLLQGILLDQFGVLHDGKQAYGGAVEAVKYLAEAGLSVVILSNSSRSKSHLL